MDKNTCLMVGSLLSHARFALRSIVEKCCMGARAVLETEGRSLREYVLASLFTHPSPALLLPRQPTRRLGDDIQTMLARTK